jgi:pre-rRNA-processing protein IPI3
MTINSNNLVVGLESGLVNIYDVTSHQLLRSINTHKGQPMAMVGSMIKPFDLMGHIEIGETSGSREDVPIRAILPFQRIRDPRAREAHEVSVLLPPTNIVGFRILSSLDVSIPHHMLSIAPDSSLDSS